MPSKWLATALIALICLGGGGPWHVENDDPDFLPPDAAHNHATHHEVFRSPIAPQTPVHCAICHWLQMFRAGAMRQARLQFATDVPGALIASSIPPVRTGALFDVPSRAPPA